ncbi:MAG: sulfotransferase [Actinomycetota bacterium]|nr:sulfotransferase [Actinomycetota bacterium]
MAQAEELAGHGDWGDRAFTEPLGLLVESCRATGRLNAVGWRVLRGVLLRHLRNRLYVQAYLKRRPEAAQRSLGSPVVITGLPRTGTSLLHNLLAQDPRHRFLRLWEALHPVPPGDGHEPDEATLVRQAETWLERFYALAPAFRAVRALTPRGPEECDALLQNAFASQHFDDMFDVEAYSRWFYHATLGREYAYYALQLRILSRDPEADRRWLLKSPGHLGHLDSLLAVLPGALVVHCHRDPAQAVPSYASLIRTVRRPHSDQVSPVVVGEQALRRCSTALHRALQVRAAAGESRFLDVSYPALVADPVATVAGIYHRLQLRLDRTVEAAMRGWLTDHPRGRQGIHRYDPDSFDLPADRVRAAFAAYLQRFAPLVAESPAAG